MDDPQRGPRSEILQESIDRFQAQSQQETANRAVQEDDGSAIKADPSANRAAVARAQSQAGGS
jgi:hypothetical protein